MNEYCSATKDLCCLKEGLFLPLEETCRKQEGYSEVVKQEMSRAPEKPPELRFASNLPDSLSTSLLARS
ncbi:Protein of unknown function [Gryllus bimaculatus]|nr:Protein of unknown function [Gryllus bimaculatus]